MTMFSQCMEQVYDRYSDGQTDGDLLNCTANDVQIARATNITFDNVCSFESDNPGVPCNRDADCVGTRAACVPDSCSYPGDWVTFNADFEVVLTAQERHDIGLYFSTDGDPDGDGALRGSCSITTLPESPNPPFVDLDTDCKGGSCPQPGDQCGDLDDPHSPMLVNIHGLSVVCVDSDGDGKLNLPNCTSWRQPGANELCTTPEDAYPGAPSKCNCDLGFNLDIDVPAARLDVIKTPSPSSIPEPGGDVNYTVEITNRSPFASVTLTQVADDEDNDGSDDAWYNPADICDKTVLGAGETATCTFAVTVIGNARAEITDRVTATGVDENQNTINGSADATVLISDVPSSLRTDKIADPDQVAEPGTDVTYVITVTNTSTVDNITIISVDDPNLGGEIGGACVPSLPAILAPGEELTCTVTQLVSGNAGDSIPNTVIAKGIDDDDVAVQDSGSANVLVTDIPSSIVTKKTANQDQVDEPGADVTYTITVTNDSIVDDVTITSVSDPNFGGDISDHCDQTVPATLGPQEVLTCTVTQLVSGNAGDIIRNTVTVSGIDDDGVELNDNDTTDVMIADVPSSISTEKTASPTSVAEPGADVTYVITVSNTSTVDKVTITSVDDPNLGGEIGAACVPSLPALLAPGEELTCTVTQLVSGNAGEVIGNTVIATGTDDDGQDVQDTGSANVTVSDVPSSISVDKTASPTSVAEPGADVTYVITVSNTSTVDKVTITSVDDSNLGGEIGAACVPSLPALLAPGEELTCTVTQLVSGNAGEVITNTATATGSDDDGNTLQASDTADVTVTDVPPSAHLSKTATTALVTYQVVVVNDSSAEGLALTALSDDKFGNITQVQGAIRSTTCSVPQNLAPNGQAGDSYTCSFNAVVNSASHVNTVTATAADDEGNVVTPAPSDSATVELK